MKNFLMGAVVTFGCMSAGFAASQPNVLFIAIDDLNSSPTAMKGETSVDTPHIDRLAERGVFFTNAHCAAPACNPSRAAVMTGIAPHTSGLYYNNQDWRENSLLNSCRTLPQHFKDHGYKTLGGGKLYHAASLSERHYVGLFDARPWDGYFPSKERQMPYEVQPEEFPVNGSEKFYRGYFDWAALDIDADEMADAKVVAWASEELSKTHDQPLFLAVGIYRPHIPFWTPKEYFDRHPLEEVELPDVLENDLEDTPAAGQAMARRHWHKWVAENDEWRKAVQGYNASVSFTDDMVGRLLDALDEGPLADNTVVVLWSDHGYHLGQKEHWEKFALWEQTTRVPLIVAGLGKQARGAHCRQAVSLLDIYPTLIDLCGLGEVEGLDGRSLSPLLKKPELKTGRGVLCTQGLGNHAVRTDRWRYIRYADGSEELYDHRSDPKEFWNLAGDSQYDLIKEELSAWLPDANAPLQPEQGSYGKKIDSTQNALK